MIFNATSATWQWRRSEAAGWSDYDVIPTYLPPDVDACLHTCSFGKSLRGICVDALGKLDVDLTKDSLDGDMLCLWASHLMPT